MAGRRRTSGRGRKITHGKGVCAERREKWETRAVESVSRRDENEDEHGDNDKEKEAEKEKLGRSDDKHTYQTELDPDALH